MEYTPRFQELFPLLGRWKSVLVAPPHPDPYPGSNDPVTLVSYTYDTPAIVSKGPDKGDLIPGYWYHCTVPAHWHGHVNLRGHRRCVMFRR